ncbi:MAG: hypothetical protein LUE12_01995 [Ruminococcus sp.]|nr:hypothetical protein [Ruminococcus sp.]
MYNKKLKKWKSIYTKSNSDWCMKSENAEKPEALFIFTDYTLTQTTVGTKAAKAVNSMKRAADCGYAWAALAMGISFTLVG